MLGVLVCSMLVRTFNMKNFFKSFLILKKDVYAFLCPNCGGNNPPSSAIQTIYNNLRAQGVNYGMLWFDIEQCDGCWNDFNSNIAFIQAAVNESVRLGMRIGLYSSEYEWTQTVGSSCTAFKNYPLWYGKYLFIFF